MATYLGRHPALPPTNNMLQLPNQQKSKKSVIRSLSKSKIFEFQDSSKQAQHQPHHNAIPEIEIPVPLTEQEHNLPQSCIRDTLLGDDKITMKDIWEGNAFVMAIVGSLQDVLTRLPNEPYGIRVNFPTMAEFNGIQIKKYPVTPKDTVHSILQQICTRFHVDLSAVSLTTLNGIPLDSSASLVSLGIGTLLHTWDVTLVHKRPTLSTLPSLAYVPPVVMGNGNEDTEHNSVSVTHLDASSSPENLNSKSILEQSGLKVLVGLLFPAGSVEFGSRLRGMQKLELFVPIRKMFADLCRQRFEITDVSSFTLATMEGITLHPDCVLADYGLGIRFSTWDLRVMRKSEALSPPFLNHSHLMWLFVPEAWATSKKPSEIIEATVSIDSKWQTTQAALLVAQKEITFLHETSDRDRKTIADLHAQIDDYVEEVNSLNASKALYVEMSDILKQDVEAFAQEKCTWKKEKERLQAYFDTIIGELETRLAQVEDENDKLKRKGIAQELMAELVQLRNKYKEAVENHERELQRVMRDNLVQRRKLVAEVEERILEMSQEKGKMAMEWNRLRTEKTTQLEELRRASEKINRERSMMERDFTVREAKIRRDFEDKFEEMRRAPITRRRSSSFDGDDLPFDHGRDEERKKLDTILEEQASWRSLKGVADVSNYKALDEANRRHKEELETMRKQLDDLRREGDQRLSDLIRRNRAEGDHQVQQLLEIQKLESEKVKEEGKAKVGQLLKECEQVNAKVKQLEEENARLQGRADEATQQTGDVQKRLMAQRDEALDDQKKFLAQRDEALSEQQKLTAQKDDALKLVEKLKLDAERVQKMIEQNQKRHKDELDNIQREMERMRETYQRTTKEETEKREKLQDQAAKLKAETSMKSKEAEEMRKTMIEKEKALEILKHRIANFEHQVSTLHQQRDHLHATHLQDLAHIRSERDRAIEISKRLEQKVGVLEKTDTELAQALTVEKEKAQQKLSTLEQRINELEQQLQHAAQEHQDIEQKYANTNQQTSSMLEELGRGLKEKADALAALRAELLRAQDEKASVEEYIKVLELRRLQAEQEVEKSEQMQSSLREELAELNAQHSLFVEQLTQLHEKDKLEHDEALKRVEHESMAQRDRYEQILEEFKQNLDSVQKQHQAQLASADTQHELHVTSLINKHEQVVSSLEAQHEHNVSSLTSQHNHQISSLADQHSQQVSSLADQHSQQISSLTDEHNQHVSSLADQHTQKVSSLAHQHSERISSLTDQHNQQLASTRDHYDNELAKLQKLLEENEKLRKDELLAVTTKLEQLDQEHQSSSTQKEEQAQTIIQEAKRSLEEAQKKFRQDVELATTQQQEFYTQKLAEVEQQHSQQVSSLTAQHQQAREELDATTRAMAETKATYEKDMNALRHERDELLVQYEAKLADLLLQTNQAREDAVRLREQVEKANEEAERSKQDAEKLRESAERAKEEVAKSRELAQYSNNDTEKLREVAAKSIQEAAKSKEEAEILKEEAARSKEAAEKLKEEATIAREVSSKSKEEAEQSKEEAAKLREEAAKSKEDAERSKEEAERSREEAVKSKEDAERLKEDAERSKEKAEKSKEEAANLKQEAERAREEAAHLKQEAERSREEASKAMEEARQSKEEATKSKQEAERLKEDAVKSKEEAERFKDEAERSKEDAAKSKEAAERSKDEAAKSKEEAHRSKEEAGKSLGLAEKLQEQAGKSSSSASQLAEVIKGLEEELSTLRNELQTTTQHKDEITHQLQRQLSDIKHKHTDQLTQAEETSKLQSEQAEQLQEQLRSSLDATKQQHQQTITEQQTLFNSTLADLQTKHTTQFSTLQTQYNDLQREHAQQQSTQKETTDKLQSSLQELTTQLEKERQQFKDDRDMWKKERASMKKTILRIEHELYKQPIPEEPSLASSVNKKALKKTGSEQSMEVKKVKYAVPLTDRTDRDKDSPGKGTAAMLIAKRLCDVERILSIKADDEVLESTDDKEGVLKVLRRIDLIKQTIARNKQTKDVKSPTKERSPATTRRNLSPIKVSPDEMDTAVLGTSPTNLADPRAEFRLATELKEQKEINHDLTAQLGVAKRQLSDMHKHHEKTLAKLKEEHMWSVNHLKRSIDKEKDLMRVQIEAEVRKQVEESLKPAWRIENKQ